MALIVNTNIRNDIDGYLVDASSVKGGYVVVSGLGEDIKENLPEATRIAGTLVYDSNEKKSYRWTGTEWKEESSGGATDVNEETFVFKKDLMTMYDVGKVEATKDNPTTIAAKGKTFKQVWNDIFLDIINPTIVQPSWTVTYSNSDVTGAVIDDATATLQFNSGSYSYGPTPTGVTVTSLLIDGVEKTLDSDNKITISLPEFTVSSTLSFSVKYSYSGAGIPVNNAGEELPDLKIEDVSDITKNYSHNFGSTGTLTTNPPSPIIDISTFTDQEVGTLVKPAYTVSINYEGGYYPNGSVEDPSSTSADVATELYRSINGGTEELITKGTYYLPDTVREDTQQSTSIKVVLNYDTSMKTPLSASKHAVPSKIMTSGSNSVSKNYVIPAGYRSIFYGYSTSTELTSTNIRSVTKNKKNAAINGELFEEMTSAKCIIIAAPTGTRTLTKVTMPSSSDADVTSQFVKQSTTVDVEGANGYTAAKYDVWIYEPAIMGGTYKITMA